MTKLQVHFYVFFFFRIHRDRLVMVDVFVAQFLAKKKWSRAFVHTEPGVEPGHRALDRAGEPCGVIELVTDQGEPNGLFKIHSSYPTLTQRTFILFIFVEVIPR